MSLANSVPQTPQQSIAGLVQKEVVAQLKGSARTGAARHVSTREAEKVRNTSQHRSSSLFLVSRRHRLHRRLLRRGTERARGRNRRKFRDHQQARRGPCETSSEEARKFRTCSTGTEAMASALPFKMATVRTRLVFVSMCVLVAEATAVTISASACSLSWLPSPKLHFRLLLIQFLLLLPLLRCPSLL